MSEVFKELPRNRPGLLHKLFNKEPKHNAFVELNNLFARKRLIEITDQDIQAIVTKYKVNFYKKFNRNLKELYAEFLHYCLKDNRLSNDEIEELRTLKEFLSLKDKDIEEIHNLVASQVYKKAFSQVIKDGRIENDEKAFLENLEQDLRLPSDLAEKLSKEARQLFIEDYVKEITEDQRLSPDELGELEAISKSLNIKLEIDAKSKAALDKMKRFWIIENGEIPVISVSINLQKNERCYFKTPAEWHELRTITKRINYGGPSARIKIMKGLSYRVGSMKVERVTKETMQQLDTGTLYVTNKRLIFTGNKKTSNIKLEKILSVIPYSNGIEIVKDAGRSPVFVVPSEADILAMTLSRAINDI